MARYIDADKLMEVIEKNIEPYKSWDCTKADVVMDTILEQPTANVEEVVRCKDCRFNKPTDYEGKSACIKQCVYKKPDDFCSYGERK